MISQQAGRDFVPYPLGLTRAPTRLNRDDEYREYLRGMPTRLREGDLSSLHPHLEMLLSNGDIRIGSYAYDYRDQSEQRIAGVRRGERGCVAVQHRETDVAAIYELSAYDLGRAVAKLVEFGKPGKLPEASLPRVTRDTVTAPPSSNGVAVQDVLMHRRELPVVAGDILKSGTVETDWQPPRTWGRRTPGGLIKWYDTAEGAYLLSARGDVVTPLTAAALLERIDRSIAADAKAIREHRNRQDPID